MKKKIILYAGIVIGLLVLAYAYVPQVLSGKIVNQSDISGRQGMSHEMMTWNAAHPDDQTAWTESMFGGMPTATIHASTKGDWTQKIYDFLLLGRRPATYLFISLLGAWLLMLALGIQPLVAVGGAIAVTFCAYNLQIIQVGHNTKMQALAFLPWVLAALIYTYNQALGTAGRGSAPAQPFTRVGSGVSGAQPDSEAMAAAGPAQGLIVSEDQCGQNPGQEGEGLHLGVVADLDDLQVVGAEGDGDGAADGQKRVYPQGEHQQPGAQQRDEQVGRRAASGQQEIVDLLRPVPARGGVDRGGRHPAEHRFGPRGGIVGVGGVPAHHLVRHPLPARDVALVDDLAAEYLRYVGVGEDEQADHDAGV